MPKKIRTWEDQLKSKLTKKKKTPNPMQKLPGMKKEHIIQNHDELLKQIHKDLDHLASREFWDDPKKDPYIMVDVQHDFSPPDDEKHLNPAFLSQPPFPHEGVDTIKLTERFTKFPPGTILVVGNDDPPLCMGKIVGSKEYEDMVDFMRVNFMRADIESGMRISQMIETVKTRMKEDGKDFNSEFKKWKDGKNAKL